MLFLIRPLLLVLVYLFNLSNIPSSILRPRDTRRFKVEVAIAAFSKISFNLTYQELLKRVQGLYEHKLYISPGVPVKDFKVYFCCVVICM